MEERPGGPSRIERLSDRFKNGELPGFREIIKAKLTKPRIVILVLALLLVIFFAVITPFAVFYTDALWYNQLGFNTLFWKMFFARITVFLVFAAAFFVFIYANILVARRLAPEQKIDIGGSPLEEFLDKARGAWAKLVGVALVLFCALSAIISGLGWGGRWEMVLRFLNHTSFGKADPLFAKDIGFYTFSYPFLRDLASWLISTIVFVLLVTAVAYLLQGGIRLRRGPEMFAPNVKAHLSVLAALFFLAKAWSYRLNMYELLFTQEGAVYGAGYTDVKARLPALWILVILSIVAAVILIANIKYRGWVLPAVAVGSIAVVTLLAGTVYPLIIQNYRVKPNERELEAPYLEHNIELTRYAFGIDDMVSRPFPAEGTLDMAAIERNFATVDNIRLWDTNPMLDAYQQLQAIRPYYSFNDVDVDRYVIDGVYRQVMISAREMTQGNLPEAARTWVNHALVYTHGFGVVVSPTRKVTEEGNPDMIVSDIPPEGPTDLQVTKPEVYFGERTVENVVVDTREDEFNFPIGEQQAYTNFEGRGGVFVKSIWRRMLFAVRFLDINMIFSGQIRNSSQVLYMRTVRERVGRCAPFLKLDRDPYIVIDDAGELYWIQDAYTTSDYFPYSEHAEGFGNYVRNSVKAVVNAYDGSVRLYVIEPEDPVIATYMKIFPDIFTSFEEMPEDLKRHLRYPEDFFTVQADLLRTYHMTDPRQFYNKEDKWDFPQEIFNDQVQPMVPYYLIMKLPGEEKEEMIIMLPFVPHKRQNMISWLAARMDGDNYGQMINFTFPSGKLIYGPEQIEGRIEQDAFISQQLSLWRREGSQVIRGNLLAIPIEDSLLYVEPLYLQAAQIKIPQIKRVIVAYEQQVVMEPTLEQALARVFAGAPPSEVTPSPDAELPVGDISELSSRGLELYNRAVEAQRAGNWSAYGEYLRELEGVLMELGAGDSNN